MAPHCWQRNAPSSHQLLVCWVFWKEKQTKTNKNKKQGIILLLQNRIRSQSSQSYKMSLCSLFCFEFMVKKWKMKWKLVEVFSARLLHILVITIIRTMVMFNISPRGSKVGGGRKLSVHSSGTSSFWNGLEDDDPNFIFQSIRSCLRISESLYAMHCMEQTSGFSWCINYRLFCWCC